MATIITSMVAPRPSGANLQTHITLITTIMYGVTITIIITKQNGEIIIITHKIRSPAPITTTDGAAPQTTIALLHLDPIITRVVIIRGAIVEIIIIISREVLLVRILLSGVAATIINLQIVEIGPIIVSRLIRLNGAPHKETISQSSATQTILLVNVICLVPIIIIQLVVGTNSRHNITLIQVTTCLVNHLSLSSLASIDHRQPNKK